MRQGEAHLSRGIRNIPLGPISQGSGTENKEQIGRSIRLLLLLEEVARIGVPATPTEINANIGLPKQTLHRLFGLLEEEGFLQREHDGRSFSPGPRLRTMATGVISSTRVRAARLMVMQSLSRDVGETCNLAIPD
ncbi:MAG: helix-turn-helix domain-containing protein, partial [Pseudomonadota bacterium]